MRRTMLDTNVLSEILRPGGDKGVVAFVSSLPDPWVSAVTFHELAFGLELLPPGRRRSSLDDGISAFREKFKDRTIPIDRSVAALSGRMRADEMRAGFRLTPLDAMIAASARAASARLATRNTKDFVRLGVPLVDPWEA
ncbi:MAG: PIN domain-containing protein [Hyphomicrobiales bacterium]|nr:PIN domain-containing protein [Hyphomicrobiales bacterium]